MVSSTRLRQCGPPQCAPGWAQRLARSRRLDNGWRPRKAGCQLRLDPPGPSRESGARDERDGAQGAGEAGAHPSRPGSIRPRGATYLGPQPPGPQPWDPSGEERGARGRPDVPSVAGGSEELPVGLGGAGRAGLRVSVLLPSLCVTQGSTGACISGVPRGAGKGVTHST